MVWKSRAEQGFEAQKVAHEVFPYFKGRVLDLGCGQRKIFPGRGVTGIDNGREAKLFNAKINTAAEGLLADLRADAIIRRP